MFLPICGEAKRLVVVHLTDTVELLETSVIFAKELAVIAALCVVHMVLFKVVVSKSALTTVVVAKFMFHALGLVS